jgi:hypothetical protein
MKTKLMGIVLGLVALAFTSAAVLPARADDNGNGNDNDNDNSINDEGLFELFEMSSRRDVVVVRCDERFIQAEQVTDELMVITCGARVIDDEVRTRSLRHRR